MALMSATMVIGLVVPAGADARSCRPVKAQGIRFDVTIERGRVSCAAARRVARGFMAGKGKLHGDPDGPQFQKTWTLYGWRCGTGTGGGACIRRGTSYRTARDYILIQAT